MKPPSFARLVNTYGKYRLYKINTTGWYTFGTSSTSFSGDKTYFYNMVKMWTGSTLLGSSEYPTINFSGSEKLSRAYNVRMTNLNNYELIFSDGQVERGKNIWKDTPLYLPAVSLDKVTWKKTKESSDYQTYTSSFTLKTDCKDCVVVLKETFHPNWRVEVNGEKVDTFPVFPFYIGIPLHTAGEYTIKATYKPGTLKVLLLSMQIIVLIGLLVLVMAKSKRIAHMRKTIAQYRSEFDI